jgi:two-component system OmpR family sensor kinase
MTLRRRVLAYVAIAALASCALTVVVAVALVRHRVAAQQMATLERQTDVVATIGDAPGALGPGGHVYGVGNGTPRRLGARRAAAVLAAIGGGGNREGTISVGGRDLAFVARTTPAGEVVLVRGAGLAFAQWRPFLWSLVIAGLGGALLAAVLSFLLARRLTRPIGELAAATGRLAGGETGVQVPVRGEDELAGLGQAFNEMSLELGSAREAQRTFLESVSHELKTPLTSIRGYAEAVDEGAVAPGDGARVIAAEADRLERLVRDLLDLARVGRADFSVAREPVELGAVAELAVERHQPSARELQVKLRHDGASGDGTWALGDEQRLLQVTSNLIENALRLTPAGGEVVVSERDSTIAVRDTGPGLEPADLPHAFERFYLHDRYRSERSVGSGLGLAIVSELVAAMGGSVQASDAPEGGAVFSVRLSPVRIADSAAAGAMPPHSARPDARRPSA